MKTTRAWRWLAAGVLALGMNWWYHDGRARWAHAVVEQAAQRTAAWLDSAGCSADQFLAEVRRALRVDSR